MPLQAYFRINTENMGQFERTLIIADEGSYVHYIEGCTAPDLLDRLAALGGRRDRSPSRARGSATRPSRTGRRTSTTSSPSARSPHERRDDGVGRLQPRLEADDEVPVDLPDGRARPTARSSRSPSPARASTRTPAARSSTPRPNTTSIDLRQVDLQGRRARAPTAACSRSPRARTRLEVEGRLRRAAARRGVALGHLPDDPDRRGRRRRRPRGDRLEDRRGAALLPADATASTRRRPRR